MYKISSQRGMTNGMIVVGMLLLATIVVVALVRDRIVSNPYDQVSISGTGKVAYVPDTALVTLGVHFENATAQGALTQMNTAMTAIIPAVEALGIAKENVTTQNFSVYPQYYYPDGGPSRISGYTADEQLLIKIVVAEGGSLEDMVAKVIESASAKGANQVIGVVFDVSNIEDLKHQALELAIKDANTRAQATADIAGVKLGKVIGWWENPISVPGQPYYNAYGGEMGMGGGGMPSVPAGGQEIIIQANVNYRIK